MEQVVQERIKKVAALIQARSAVALCGKSTIEILNFS